MGVLANQYKREQEMRQLRRMASQNTDVPVTDANIRQADASQLIQALPKNRQLPITPEQQAQIGLPQGYTPQPVQPMPPQRNTWNGNKNIVQNIAGGLQNVGTDIGNAVVNTVANAPQLVTGMVDSAKQNLTAEGLGNTLPALGRGALQAVDFVPGMAGLIASGINSFAGKDVIPMDNGWHNPVQYTLEQLKDKMDMQKRLQTPVVRPDARIGVAGDNYVYNGKTPNALSQYLVGANPGADKAQFAEDMVKFGAQMAMGGAGAKLAQGAVKASNLKKAENLQKTVEATKNAEQKAKYAKQLEKLKQAQQQAKKQNDYLQKLKDNTVFGGAVGLTEGENLEERLQSGLGAGALGVGGTLAHVGLGKVAKSKPVKSVTGKIANKTNDFIDKHHNVANTVGTLSSIMNTDVTSPLAKKYKGLNDVVSENTNIAKRLNEHQLELFKKASELSEEDSKAVIEALKKGETKRAEDIIKKKDYEINNRLKNGEKVSESEINEQTQSKFDAMIDRANKSQKKTQPQASESNLSEVKQEKGTNTPEEVKTSVKTQSDMSGEVLDKTTLEKRIRGLKRALDENIDGDENGAYIIDEAKYNRDKAQLQEYERQLKELNDKEADERHKFVQEDIARMNREEAERNAKYEAEAKARKERWEQLKNSSSKQTKQEIINEVKEKNKKQKTKTQKEIKQEIKKEETKQEEVKQEPKQEETKKEIIEKVKEKNETQKQQETNNKKQVNNQSVFSDLLDKRKRLNLTFKPADEPINAKVKKLGSGKAETMELNERTKNEFDSEGNVIKRENIYENVDSETKKYNKKNDALKDQIFVNAKTGEKVSALKKDGSMRDGLIVSGSQYDARFGKRVYIVKASKVQTIENKIKAIGSKLKILQDKTGIKDKRLKQIYDVLDNEETLKKLAKHKIKDTNKKKIVQLLKELKSLKERLKIENEEENLLIDESKNTERTIAEDLVEEQKESKLSDEADFAEDRAKEKHNEIAEEIREKDENEQDESVVEDVNEKYIEKGNNIESQNAGLSPKYNRKELVNENRTKVDEERANNFNKFYNNLKLVLINNKSRAEQYFARKFRDLDYDTQQYYLSEISEQTLQDVNNARPKKVGDSTKKYENAQKIQDAIFDILSKNKDLIKPKSEKQKTYVETGKQIDDTLKVFEENTRNVLKTIYSEITKGIDKSSKNYKRIEEIKKSIINDTFDDAKIGSIIEKTFELVNKSDTAYGDVQGLYDAYIREINKTYQSGAMANKLNVRMLSIDTLNKVADKYNVNKIAPESEKPNIKYANDYIELEKAISNKDVKAVDDILWKHNHNMHKYANLSSRQRKAVEDAYHFKANDFVEQVRTWFDRINKKYEDYVNKQKEIALEKGVTEEQWNKWVKEKEEGVDGGAFDKWIYKSLEHFRADEILRLRKRYKELGSILENSFTDRALNEVKSFNRYTGKLEGTGDVWDRDISGLPKQEIEYIREEIENILNNATEENIINRFRTNTKEVVNDIPGDIVEKYKLKSNNQNDEYKLAVKEARILEEQVNAIEKKQSAEIKSLENKIKIAKTRSYSGQEDVIKYEKQLKDVKEKYAKELEPLNKQLKQAWGKENALSKENIGSKKYDDNVDYEALEKELSRLKSDNYKITKEDYYDIIHKFKRETRKDKIKLEGIKDLIKRRLGNDRTALTKREAYYYDQFRRALEEYKIKPLENAYRNRIRSRNKALDEAETPTAAKARDVITKGADVTIKAKEVEPNKHHKFIEVLTRKVGGTKNTKHVLDAVKAFMETGNHTDYDNIPEIFKKNKKTGNYIDRSFYGTTFKPVQAIKNMLRHNSDNGLAKRVFSNIDADTMITIMKESAFGKNNNTLGITKPDGSILVRFKNHNQFINTVAHEIGHKFIYDNFKQNPDLVENITGLTEKELKAVFRANKAYNDFTESPDYNIYMKVKNSGLEINENNFTPDEIKIYNNGEKVIKEYFNEKVEDFCNKLGDEIERNYDAEQSRLSGKETGEGTKGTSVRNERGDGQLSEGTSERRIDNSGEGISRSNENLKEEGTNTPEKTKDFVNDAVATSKDVINSFSEIFGNDIVNKIDTITKNFNQSLKGDAKPVYDCIKDFSDDTTNVLIRNKSLTNERARNVLYKFDELGEGTYFNSYSKGKGKFKFKEALSGLLGHKKTYGKNADNALNVLYATAQRNIRAHQAERIVNYVKEQFGEQSSRGKSHPENYVPVNSSMLFNICFHRLSKTFYETINKGEKAIKETFKEDAPEILELVKATKKPDIYIPKEVLNKIFDGSGEIPSVFYKRYIKGRPLSKQTLGLVGKLSGLYLDTVNEQFKKMVLTTSSFFANNRLGNQIMLMARSDRLGDYVKGLYEAVKLKDSEVPKQLVESTLLNAEEMLGSLRRPSGWGQFDAMRNLLDGNMIDTAELKGMKKLGAQTANVCLGLPNKGWNAVTRALMKVNENFERFERKQAYSQTLSKAKRENVLTVAQKATAVKEFYKHLDQNKELSDYIIKKAEDVLGDYDNFSPAEKHIFKRLIPFYSWHRTIFRNTLHLIKENPTRAAILALKMYSMLNRDNGREEWQRGANEDIFGIKLPKGIVSNKSSVFPYMTILDDYNKARSLTPFASKSERGTDNPVGDLSPGIRIPVEALKGEKAFAPASEIQDSNWKRVTKDGKKGYFNKNNGKFVTHTPMSVREKYVRRQLIGNTLYPALGNPMFKGLGTALTSGKGKFPDKVYDTSLGGFYDGDYIGEFDGKKKYRSARNNLPLGAQLATRFLGLGLQSDTALQKSSSSDSKKLKKKQQNYKNKRNKRRNK